MLALMLLTGVVAGFCSVGLLALINTLINNQKGITLSLGLLFIGVALVKIVSNGLSQLLLVYCAQDTILHLGLTLCRRIVRAPLRVLENRGAAQILATLTDDTSALAWSVQCLPSLVINLSVLLGCSVYLLWLSWPVFLAVVGLALLGLAGYKHLYNRVLSANLAAREARATLFGHFRGLTDGIKELMRHRDRRDVFLSGEIGKTATALRDLNMYATKQYLVAEGWTQAVFYTLIGVILLALPNVQPLPAESVTGYIFAMLYMMAPMWAVISTLPVLGRGQVALQQIERLGLTLDRELHPKDGKRPLASVLQSPLTVELKGILFQYEGDGKQEERGFSLGPLDLTLSSGELVFVIGGNGSGKTSLVKILSGLYPPQTGTVALNGQTVTVLNQDWYRQHFAVVFPDFYLFKRLLGLVPEFIEQHGQEFLALLHMDHKVRILDGAYTTTDLSQGQRKRLALVTALLEDRPFYVFDEWAADQDPQYKEVFYGSLLPGLRSKGKGVLVVTHDDRFFSIGDRVVKLEEGRIVEVSELVGTPMAGDHSDQPASQKNLRVDQ